MIKLDGSIQDFLQHLEVGDRFEMLQRYDFGTKSRVHCVHSCVVKKVTPSRVTLSINGFDETFTKKDGREYGGEDRQCRSCLSMKDLQPEAIAAAHEENRLDHLVYKVQKIAENRGKLRALGIQNLEAILAIFESQSTEVRSDT